jgi:hypothetical protein
MSHLLDSNNPKVVEDESKLYSFSPALPLDARVALAKNPDNESVIPQIDESGTIQQPKLTKVIEVSPNFTTLLNLDLDKPEGDSHKLKSQTHTRNLSTIAEATPSQEQIASEVRSGLQNESQDNSSPNSEQSGEFIMVSPKQDEKHIDPSLAQTVSQVNVETLRKPRRLNSFDGEPMSITIKSPNLPEKQIKYGPKFEEPVNGVTKQLCKQSPISPQSFSGSPTLTTIQNPSFEMNSNFKDDREDEPKETSNEPFKISEVLPNFPNSNTLQTETIGSTAINEAHLTSQPEVLPESFSGDVTHVTIQKPVDHRESANSLHSYDGESTKVTLHDSRAPFPQEMETYFNHHQHTHLDGDEHCLPSHPPPVVDFSNHSEIDHNNSFTSLYSCDGESTRVKVQNSPYTIPESLNSQSDHNTDETKVEEHKLTDHSSSLPISFSGNPTFIRVQNPEMTLKKDESKEFEHTADTSDLIQKRKVEDLPIISHSLDIEGSSTISEMTNSNLSNHMQQSAKELPKLSEFKTPLGAPIINQESKEEFFDVEETPSNMHLQATSAISNSSSPSKKALKVQFSTEESEEEQEVEDDEDDEDVNYYKILTLPSFPKKVPSNELVEEKYKKQIILAQFDKYEYKTQQSKLSTDEDEQDEIEQGIEMRLKAITESYLVLIDYQEQLRYFSHRQHTPHEEFEFDYDSLVPRSYDLIFCKLFHEELIKVLFPPRFFFIPITIVLGYILGFYYYGFVGLVIGGYMLSYLGDYLDTRPNCSTITKWNTLNDNQRKACIHGLSRKFL